MRAIYRLRSWLQNLWHRSRVETGMDEEFRFHLEAYAADLTARGLSPQEALRRALLEFGGVELQKDECRASLGLRLGDELAADLRYGWRALRQSPAFATIAILSLALGIGANTAIFSITERVLLQPLAVSHPEELQVLSWMAPAGPPVIHHVWGDYTPLPAGGHTSTALSYPVFLRMRQGNTVLQDLFAAKAVTQLTATIDGHAELVSGELVSGTYYANLGVQPVLGRAILPSDDTPASPPMALISDGFWSRRFGRSTQTLGRTLRVNGTIVTITGINPPGFEGTHMGDAPDMFFPMALQPRLVLLPGSGSLLEDANTFWVQAMGRRKPGVTAAQAQASLAVNFSQALGDTLPKKKNEAVPRLQLLAGTRGYDGLTATYSKPLYLLMAMAAAVLLLACVNLANLLLARAVARQRELHIRAALGAGRPRIVRQVLTESMLLAALGGLAGTALGYVARGLIPALTHQPWQHSQIEARFDLRVLLCSVALSLFTGLLFGLAPAWHASREAIYTGGLKEAGRATAGLRRAVVGKSLVALQVCLSVLLLIAAGLFLRTLANLRSTTIGFQPQQVLLCSLDPPRQRYAAARRVQFFRQVEDAFAAVSGISSVTASSDALVANDSSTDDFDPNGQPPRHDEANPTWKNSVGVRFFETMGITILAGRGFNQYDTATSQPVAVINQLLARRAFPHSNPIGRTFNKNHVTIIGICADSKFSDLRSAAPPTYFRPYLQEDDVWSMTYEVKTFSQPETIVPALRRAVSEIDRDVPLTDIRTQTDQIEATLKQERLLATLTSGFGLLALLLATIGIFGVMAYTVALRTREIGIRMALGAQPLQVFRSILFEAGSLTVLGMAAGILLALGLARLIASLLYGLKPADPFTLFSATLLLLAITLFAAWVPARRASRIDPVETLRHD